MAGLAKSLGYCNNGYMRLVKQRERLETFFKAHTRLEYKKGETVIRPEDEPSGVFLIEWGFIKAFNITKYGEENLLLVRSSGSIFPLIWVFTGKHGQTSYQTMTPTSLWRVDKEDYLKFLDKNPDILPVVLDMSIESYRLHSERVITLSYKTARERIASFLVSNARIFGIENEDGSVTINAPYKQADIASSVNTTRETASREIRLLKRRKLIAVDSGSITIINIEKLRSEIL